MSGNQESKGSTRLDLCDIVIDTNIWVHASNEGLDKYPDAFAFLAALGQSKTKLCFDVEVPLDEASNKSKIFAEYDARIPKSSLPYYLLVELLSSGRHVSVDTRVDTSQRKTIVQNINDRSDHVFARVATNSTSKFLVSHDNGMLHSKCRKALRQDCGVVVSTCAEMLPK